MRDVDIFTFYALAVVALLILQASSVAKESSAIMRHQITRAEQSAAACRMKP